MKYETCPCCGNDRRAEFITYHDLPEILFPVDREVSSQIRRRDLKLTLCRVCGHVYQEHVEKTTNARIYSELYLYYPFAQSEAFLSPYREPFERCFEKFFPSQASGEALLEIGCSSSALMSFFSRKGFTCTGIDPSAAEFSEAGVKVHRASYERHEFRTTFDIIVMRFNLEHIVDIDLYMRKLCRESELGTLVFVQVPNLASFIAEGTLCVGAHEHVQYFTPESLNTLFARYGFQQRMLFDASAPSVIACFQKVVGGVLSKARADVEGQRENLMLMLKRAVTSLERVTMDCRNLLFYGCGLPLAWVLYCSGICLRGKMIRIADDNPLVHGRYMPGTKCPVVIPSSEALRDCDLVLLSMSRIYHECALQKVKERAPAQRVAVLRPEGWSLLAEYAS